VNRRLCAVVLACTLAGAGVALGQFLEAVVPVGDTPGEILWNPTYNKVYCVNEQDASVTVISGATNEVLTTIDVGDYPSFLCLSADGRKVHCSRGAENRLVVIDARSDTVLKTLSIPGYPGHMVYNSTMNKLYISCNDDPVYRITVMDCGPDTILHHVSVRDVGRLLWHPSTNSVFCYTDRDADTAKIIDCFGDTVVHVLPIDNGGYGGLVPELGEWPGLSIWPSCRARTLTYR
jgi:YVTN family beta-propeller protein